MSKQKGCICALFLVISTFVFLPGGSSVLATGAKSPTDLLARIGKRSILRQDLQKEISDFVASQDPNAGSFLETDEGKKQFLNQMIEIALMEKEAEELKLKDKQELQHEIREVTAALISQLYIGELLKDVAPSKKEIQDFYDANKELFTEPGRYHLHQITFKDKAEADKAKLEISAGKSFMEIAKTSSVDNFKASGGDRGFATADELAAPLATALATLKQDELSDPIELAKDQHVIIKYTELKPGTVKPIESVSEQIEGEMSSEKRQMAFESRIDELKKEYSFSINQEALELLAKEEFTPQDLDTTLFKIADKEIKIAAVAPDLERIPAFIRPHVLSGEGLNDFLTQFYARELVKKYVLDNFDKLAEKYPDSKQDAEKRVFLKFLLDEHVTNKVTLSDEDLRDFYVKNVDQFSQPPQTKAHHILVPTEELAEKLQKDIAGGKSFEEVAKAESKCPSGQQGGDLGFFGQGQMVPEFDKVAQEAEIGKVVGPVKTQFGYHLIRVDERKAAETAPFETVKDQIREQLLPEEQKKAYQGFISSLRAKFPVEEYPEKL